MTEIDTSLFPPLFTNILFFTKKRNNKKKEKRKKTTESHQLIYITFVAGFPKRADTIILLLFTLLFGLFEAVKEKRKIENEKWRKKATVKFRHTKKSNKVCPACVDQIENCKRK